jgi:hypothetical protein
LACDHQLREVSAHGRGAVEHRGRVRDLSLELDTRRGKTLSVRRHAGTESTATGKWCGGRAGRRERARLVDAPQFLRIALRPAARERGVVVDENERTTVYGFAFEYRFHQDKSFAILIAARIGQFIVGAGELPVKKPEECASLGLRIRCQAWRKKRLDRVGVRPLFDGRAIARVVPRRKCRQSGVSLWGERNRKSFETHWWSCPASRTLAQSCVFVHDCA